MAPSAVTWGEFAKAAPDLGAAGVHLLRSFTLGYLATVGDDGAPRVAPVTVTLHDDGLYFFARSRTPKAQDLARDSRYALHAFPHFPSSASFDDEEFAIRGVAVAVEDAELSAAVQAVHNDSIEEDAQLYRLDVAEALHKQRVKGRAVYARWCSE